MDRQAGRQRPGGRTARTRDQVLSALRQLLTEGGPTDLTVAEVAGRSGVNATTIYRRWGSVEALVLDLAVADVNQDSPLPVTGDLRADLSSWAHQLVRDVSRPDGLRLFRAIVAAAAAPAVADDDPHRVEALVQPRLDQFARVLEASGTTDLTPYDVVNLVLSPVYLAAVFTSPARLVDVIDVTQLVDDLIAVRDHRATVRSRR